MTLPTSVAKDLDRAGLLWAADVPLSRRTWWRVGGSADAIVTARTLPELVAAQQLAAAHQVPLHPLGNGSNMLVSDDGIRGIVVQLVGNLADTQVEGDELTAGGGMKLNVLLARAARDRWPGLEGLVGIPGTVGGAVRMNAGTSLGEIADRLVRATLVLRGGDVVCVPAADLHLSYRHSELPEGAIVADATLRLVGDWQASHDASRAFLDRRKATQPLDQPSCGSTFTNPPGDAAGRLVEAAGLKGFAIGGAMVSPKHANFVVNTGDATADDIRQVIDHVRREVHTQFGVALQPEVQLAGRWAPWERLDV